MSEEEVRGEEGAEGDESTAEVRKSKQKLFFFFSFLNMNQM